MNRIILVGNGFDLAHNLRTSYKDFMDWYWGQWRIQLKKSHRRVEDDDHHHGALLVTQMFHHTTQHSISKGMPYPQLYRLIIIK